MQKKFLQWFFENLEKNNIEYSVLRNYEPLPDKVEGSDIDLLINKDDFRIFQNEIFPGINKIGYKLWKKYRKNYDIVHMIFVPISCSGSQDIVRIDFYKNSVKWFGHELIDSNILFTNSFIWKGVSVLNNPEKLSLTLLNTFIYGGRLKDKYLTEYLSLDVSKKNAVDGYLVSSLGIKGKEIIEALKNGKTDKFNTKIIRKQFLKNRGFNLFHNLNGTLGYFYTLYNRILNPPGMFLVLTGPDGSGKSTISEIISERCKRIFPKILHFHLFPKLKLFSLIDNRSNRNWNDRHKENTEWDLRKKKFPFFRSFLMSFYLLVRFWLGYIIYIYPQLLKGSLIIGERWKYDIIIDPASKGITLPLFLRRFFFAISPNPTKTILLEGNEEDIFARKDEIPFNEIKRQIETAKSEFEKRKNTYFVSCTEPLDLTFKNILSIICQ